MHDGLRSARDQGIAILVVGVGAALSCACGWRRPHHSPFAFSEYTTLDVVGVCAGLVLVAAGLFRTWTTQSALRAAMKVQDARFFARAGLAYDIYELLLGIAAADGRVPDPKRATIERLLLSELPERVLPQDLASWAPRITVPRAPQEWRGR